MREVSILAYGAGNIKSVQRAFERISIKTNIVSNASEIERAEHLVLPGVGAFKHCKNLIDKKGLKSALSRHLSGPKPFLGICVGMQLMFSESEEFGTNRGFNVISGQVKKIVTFSPNKVPVVGWKVVEPTSTRDFFDGLNSFYFVHSFHGVPKNCSEQAGVYRLNNQKITAAVARDNKIGVQFHPEKSGESGLLFLKKFTEL